jgi:ABC-2 type transport system permease protein
MRNSDYFRFENDTVTEAEAQEGLQRGDLSFVVTFPADFGRDLVRGQRPQVLIEADATDPSAASNAVNAFGRIVDDALRDDLVGPMAQEKRGQPAVDVVVHRLYNPEGITRYNIVPGLLGIILTMTLVMMTALAVTRERERGTMENLLAMPVRPIEVMAGKIAPYIFIGGMQVAVVLAAARLLFGVPFAGSFAMFAVATLLFITVNLAIGFTFSTIAQNQLQAMQMSFFFLMPSILLSGFAFPFRGMPGWAQAIGEVLPVTHFLRIVRGLMLKAASPGQLSEELAVLALTLIVVSAVAITRYKVTLD